MPNDRDDRGQFLERLSGALSIVERLCALVAGYAMMVVVVIGCLAVVSRHMAGFPIVGIIDVIEALMVPIALAGISLCQSHAGHVRMTLFTARIRGARARHAANLVGYGIGLAFNLAMLVTCAFFARDLFVLGGASADIGIPTWIAAFVVCGSLLLMVLRLLIQTIATIRMIVRPDAVPHGLPAESESHSLPVEV